MHPKWLLLLVCSVGVWTLDPDETLSLSELIASRGYRLQEYQVLTRDGYINSVHRVVPVHFDPTTYSLFRKPVIVFHGILSDSAIFYINSPFDNSTTLNCGDNFGFCMLHSGRYDLWVPNARGNRYSRGHVRYTDRDARYWAFSMNEIALYDLPAFIGLVQRVTGYRRLGYIGYSQGSATMLMLLSERPQFAQLIQPFILWAPAVLVDHGQTIIGPPLVLSAPVLTRLPGEFLPSASFNNPLLQYFACRLSIGQQLCSLFYQFTYGPSVSFNSSRLNTYNHHTPSAVSNWQVAHYGQIAAKKQLTKFDYGSALANRQAYGVPYAPLWPLWRIGQNGNNLVLVVMYSNTDWFVNTVDAHRLIRTLRHFGVHVLDHRIAAPIFSHTDFLMGKGAGRLVYEPTLHYLDRFSQ